MQSSCDYESVFAEKLGFRSKVGLYVDEAISYVFYSQEKYVLKKPPPTHGLHFPGELRLTPPASGWFMVAGGGGVIATLLSSNLALSGRPEKTDHSAPIKV